MNTQTFNPIKAFVKGWLEKKASSIDHASVFKDVNQEIDISGGYFIILTLANLIALSGLIQNSSAVIIGAMLISPLMGPMLSFGFAFITGYSVIWNKSLKKITISVVISIIIAAVATFFSPLKDITSEIIARTRPNLYDLIIAFLAGTAGAAAICTKKNYLTIVPGVAIATAVIPPLSVAGFGLGTWNFKILFGGFFLFFTNFVAIIISTCIVFFIYGFRPSMITEADVAKLKKRVAVLGVVLFIISIPLIYTLERSISEVGLRNNIQIILKQFFDKEKESSLVTFRYTKEKDKSLQISAVVRTVDYIKESEITNIEKIIKDSLKYESKLYVDQIKVHLGGLKDENVKPSVPAIAPVKAPAEIIKTSRESVINVIGQSFEKVEKIMSPSTIEDFNIGFHGKTFEAVIALKIKKDSAVSDEEILWLERILSAELNLPVNLKVETVPFVPLIMFKKGDVSLTVEAKKSLAAVKEVYAKDPAINITVEAFPESSVINNNLSGKRVKAVIAVLVEDYKIPESNINTIIHNKTITTPTVKISINTARKKS